MNSRFLIFSVPKGTKATRVEIENNGRIVKIYCEKLMNDSNQKIENCFPIIEIGKTKADEIMNFEPKTDRQKAVKEATMRAINEGIMDFRVPIYSPSLSYSNEITFEKGKKPLVGKDENFWVKVAKEYNPEKNSRIGTETEYYVFLATLILFLIEKKGLKADEAWTEVCDYSENLGNFFDTKGGTHEFELTGSRPVDKWCDLGNTRKIIYNEEAKKYELAGGSYANLSFKHPLANTRLIREKDNMIYESTGWIIMDV